MSRSNHHLVRVTALLILALPAIASADEVWLSSLDLTKMRQGWGEPHSDQSLMEGPITIAGRKFERGVATHAKSTLWLELDGEVTEFLASVGVDDTAAGGTASVEFIVAGDGKSLWRSGVMHHGDESKDIRVDVRGMRSLLLLVMPTDDGVNFDHADWAEARFLYDGAAPVAIVAPREDPVILTPKPGPAPRINGPGVYGCRPGNPFLYRVPTTGVRPIAFTCDNLPASLSLNTEMGIIVGTAPERGTYEVMLRAKNHHGEASRSFRIVSGDTLALTPPMGWNHWYAHYNRITNAMMREAADIMVSSGMADVGYQFVSIDDCWMNAEEYDDPLRVGPPRDANGNILPNQHFPDMRGLTDYIHAKGLKAGIYISPGPRTCAGFAGSYGHEAQDAKQFAEWGFDLLKYDLCSYGEIIGSSMTVEALKKPYILMGGLLKQQPRDIQMNLCEYGLGDVWEWGKEVGGQSWRTSGDLGFELNRIFDVALANAKHAEFSGPGSWNDPDYIQIGYIGDARTTGMPTPCSLTPNEQYAFMSLWCLMASPLFYSGDMSRLDDFTINVLCNPEVIAIDQDPLGKCAPVIPLAEETFAMVKDLEDGSTAVGLFNPGEFAVPITLTWVDAGLSGVRIVRDLWRQTDIGEFSGKFEATGGRHGVVMVRMSRPDKDS
ncbi:MAG: NPCBM/NEW2 domain-containing protein [Candidatus Hydrogenedentes bacterium]|nr:NPCBM/NEW2 domain-containing protein [Candidatus Hydrogenedentota bacterium]